MFSINPRNLPYAPSYDRALEVYEQSVEQRDGWRGLVSKRDTSKRVCRRGADVAFRFHNTDLVVWKSRTQVEVKLWDSVSSRLFANQFLPNGVEMETRNGYTGLMTRRGFTVGGAGPMVVNFIHNEWVLHDDGSFPKFYKFTADRKVAAEVRKHLAPYFKFLAALEALTQTSRLRTYRGRRGKQTHLSSALKPIRQHECRYFWERLADPSQYMTLAKELLVTNDTLRLSLLAFRGGIVQTPLPQGEPPRPQRLARFV